MGLRFITTEGLQIAWVAVASLLNGVFLYANIAVTTPVVTFPINSQVPPVARVLEPFEFNFSASTFAGDSTLIYNLSNAPSWLTLDGSMRTLSGIAPAYAGNTAPVIQITASDDTGSVTTNATLVVSDRPAPVIAIPLEDQLDTFGTTSPPSSILYYASTPFNFSFNLGTFSQKDLSYYAVTIDNTPLPDWILFDQTSLSFSGLTPPSSSLQQPPQSWGLQLIGSDVSGFAGTAIEFIISVGNHKLDFREDFLVINASVGHEVSFVNLTGSLELDGRPASVSDIASLNCQTPDWLMFDKSTFEFSGTPPLGAKSSNVTVVAVDIYGDTASALLHVDILVSIFNGAIGPLNITAGEYFRHDFTASFLNATDVEASIHIDPPSPWISFNSMALILSGIAPMSDQLSVRIIELQVASKLSGISDSRTFKLDVVPPQQPFPTTVTIISTETATSGAPCTDCIQALPSGNKSLSGGEIAAIVLSAALAVGVGILLCFCCFRRRRRCIIRRGVNPEKSEISNPIGTPTPADGRGEIHSLVESSDTNLSTILNSDRHTAALRRHSQALPTLVGGVSMNLKDSRGLTTRPRSYSENALSGYGSRNTQDGTYPPLPQLAARRSPTRNTKNFSRKSSAPLSLTQRPSGDVLSSRFSEQTSRASKSSLQNTTNLAYDDESINDQRISRRRTPSYRFIPNIGQRTSGLGHGSQNSTADFSFTGAIRGRGLLDPTRSTFEFTSQHHFLHRDDESWQTIDNTRHQPRHSIISALTESTEVLNSPKKMTLRQVPKSPTEPSNTQLFMDKVLSRTVSKRTAGSSPFFAGSSRTASRGTSKKSRRPLRPIHTDFRSPLPARDWEANGGLEISVMAGLRNRRQSSPNSETEAADDSFGFDYGTPREGTRQLRLFTSQLGNRVSQSFRNSLQFSDSDSRFRSAEPSPGPLHHRNSPDQENGLEHGHSQYGYMPGHRLPSPRILIGERPDHTERLEEVAGMPSPARSAGPLSPPRHSERGEYGDIVIDDAEDSDTYGAFL